MARYQKKRRHIGRFLFILFLLVIAGLFADSYFRIVTTEYDLDCTGLPSNFEGLRILQISDTHGYEFGEGNQRLLEQVFVAAPDIIVITGDFIDDVGQEDMARALMAGLAAIAPTYYVTGNHEWACGELSDLEAIMEETGVTYLSNTYTLLTIGDQQIVLAGMDDPQGPYDMMTPDELMAQIQAEVGDLYTILLYHRNNRLEDFAEMGYDLVFSGHAHGGLIRLPFTDGLVDAGRNWFPSYTSGVYSSGTTQMVVSRGLIPFYIAPRFLNNPHIPVAILHCA